MSIFKKQRTFALSHHVFSLPMMRMLSKVFLLEEESSALLSRNSGSATTWSSWDPGGWSSSFNVYTGGLVTSLSLVASSELLYK